MKKRDLFLTGILMLALPASVMAQVEEATVVRTSDDAKVMFTQKFEATGGLDADAAWEQWSTTAVDTIKQITYINHVGSESNLAIYTDNADEWKTTFVKDSLILMKNGVMTTDDAGDIKGGYFDDDDYTLFFDDGLDQERNLAFAEYGEDGGKYYFQYVSDDATGSANYSDGIVPNYRRNLFVRGLNVEDESSYRLTLYVKAKQKGKTKPTFYADVMRGYFHSEKPFSMGYVNDNNNYQYNTTFEYKKEDFQFDKWEKVTFMTYYLNDSIADGFCYTAYWWAGGSEWSFRPSDDALAAAGVTLGANDSLKHVRQPDKFFVRLSFASDSTEFSVDNISLTKSWIGGVEYHDDMIRVDFGYQTNLKDLAIAAGKNSFVNAIELGGEYFDVLGYRARTKQWYKIPINSAEYHDDGYMYMWTKPTIDGSQYIINKFDVYDSVLVSFRNPDEKELRLNYNGSNFPMALNTDWIKDGKKVHDFTNEIATPNPNIGKGVYSMKNLPPVVTDMEHEKGSFQLPGDLSSMQFAFSRPVLIDSEAGSSSKYALLIVEKNGVKEFWIPSAQNPEDEADSIVTFTRQQADITKNGELDGDYSFTLANIQGFGTDYAKNTVIDYSFGETVMATDIADIDFADYEDSDDFTTDVASLKIAGFSGYRCAAKVKSFTGAYEKGLMWGLYGVSTGAEPDEAGAGAKSCNLYYTFEAKEDGAMSISFGLTGCQKGSWNDDANIYIRILDSEGNEMARVDDGATGFKPEEGGQVSEVKEYLISANLKAGTYKLAIALPKEGSWGGGHKGGKILWYLSIKSNFTLGYPYVAKLNKAIAALEANFDLVDDYEDKYSGEVYEATKVIYDDLVNFSDTKPSLYTTITDSLTKANNDLKARFKVVDAMWASYDTLLVKEDLYAGDYVDIDGVDYSLTEAYDAVETYLADYESYECYDKSDDEINAVKAQLDSVAKLMDDRRALTLEFFKSVEAADAIVSDAGAATTIDEYAVLSQTLDDAYAVVDELASLSDADLRELIDKLNSGVTAYDAFVASAAATTVRLKALADLAKAVNAEFGDDTQSYFAQIDAAVLDNDDLAEVFKSAIKVAMYEQLAEDASLEEDLTSFIKNFNLYATPILNEVDVTKDNSGNTLKNASIVTEGAQIQEIEHRWNTAHVWGIIIDREFDNLYPGWTVKSDNNAGSGNRYVTPDASADKEYENFPKGLPIFDGMLAMDWNSKAELKTVLEDLPAGIYTLGVELSSQVKTASLTAVAADSTYTKNLSADDNTIEEIVVKDGKLSIDFVLASGDFWSKADNFSLKFESLSEYDYAADLATEKAKLEQLISFVDAADEAKATVEYTTLTGIPVPAPQAGQILIKIVTYADGTSKAETVIIK